MKLHLIRHAKANKSSDSGSDRDRSLSERGKLQAHALQKWIEQKTIEARVLCSEAKRTIETFEIINEKGSFHDINFLSEFYLCSYKTYLNQICKYKEEKDLIIVGHNFGISDLVNYFCETEIEMQTGEYICIDFKDLSWEETFRGTGIISNRYRL